MEPAYLCALAALDADIRVDGMLTLQFSADRVHRTLLGTKRTSDTLVGNVVEISALQDFAVQRWL